MGIIGNALGDLHREDVCSSRLRSECRWGLVLRLLGCHDMEDRIKLTVVGNPDLIFLIPFRSAEIDEVIQAYGCHHGNRKDGVGEECVSMCRYGWAQAH